MLGWVNCLWHDPNWTVFEIKNKCRVKKQALQRDAHGIPDSWMGVDAVPSVHSLINFIKKQMPLAWWLGHLFWCVGVASDASYSVVRGLLLTRVPLSLHSWVQWTQRDVHQLMPESFVPVVGVQFDQGVMLHKQDKLRHQLRGWWRIKTWKTIYQKDNTCGYTSAEWAC